MRVTKEIIVAQTGVGKPDYSKEISLGRERPGTTLKYGQTLKYFGRAFSPIVSPYPHITTPLAPGASEHYIDAETGIILPYTVEQGYTIAIISASSAFTQDAILWGYWGTPPLPNYLALTLGAPIGGAVFYQAEIVGFGSALYDPTAEDEHQMDIVVTNNGGDNLQGGGTIFAILAAVGTAPLPPTKTVRCKFCGYEEVVPRETTSWNCPECGRLNIYLDLSRFRETP